MGIEVLLEGTDVFSFHTEFKVTGDGGDWCFGSCSEEYGELCTELCEEGEETLYFGVR